MRSRSMAMGLPEFGQVVSDNERAAPTPIGARPERYGLSVYAEY